MCIIFLERRRKGGGFTRSYFKRFMISCMGDVIVEATKEKKQFTDYFTDFARKWVPDSYVIALVLTIVAFIMALFLTESGPFDIVIAWGKGFWTLLAFAMQMSLIVITGYALATTPICTRLIS